MRSSVAAVALAFAMAIGSDHAVAADTSTPKPRTSHKTHLGVHLRNHVGGRPYSSYYLGRPIYYSPGPLFPWLPFIPDWRDPQDW